jgi:hypothetical protein
MIPTDSVEGTSLTSTPVEGVLVNTDANGRLRVSKERATGELNLRKSVFNFTHTVSSSTSDGSGITVCHQYTHRITSMSDDDNEFAKSPRMLASPPFLRRTHCKATKPVAFVFVRSSA